MMFHYPYYSYSPRKYPRYPYGNYSPYRRPIKPLSPSHNNSSTSKEEEKKEQRKEPKEEKEKEKKFEEPFFEIFGIKLYFDDILLVCLIFFLYKEGVEDQSLFISLILLLLS